jgi:hypothetical protein
LNGYINRYQHNDIVLINTQLSWPSSYCDSLLQARLCYFPMWVLRQFKSSYETDTVNIYIKFSVTEYEWYVDGRLYTIIHFMFAYTKLKTEVTKKPLFKPNERYFLPQMLANLSTFILSDLFHILLIGIHPPFRKLICLFGYRIKGVVLSCCG